MTAMNSIRNKLTNKQFDTLITWLDKKPKTTLLSGGK